MKKKRRRKGINPRNTFIKHIPQRTCLACRKVKAKREMVRLVRTTDGTVAVDASSKRDGRGAYLCPEWQCWEAGLKGSRLEHVLRINLTQDNRERLIQHGRSLAGVSQ